ncbi:hypothetical protein FRB93_002828 [Tulasnella sp. JGI-2019a]|nr:hypothetical protein FRB93_002828 [Tulasnella sp. JGI-2019a]
MRRARIHPDAPIEYGQQAKAAGEFFSTVPIHTIITSPLKRAFTTAQQILKNQPDASKPPLISTPLIREQHFGEAEGHTWLAPVSSSSGGDSGRMGIIDPKTREKSYPVQYGRQAKFPAGECLEDVALRTGEAFDTLILPIVKKSEGKACGEVNVFFVSHGIAISETIGAIFARCIGGDKVDPDTWRGLKNTAWTRLVIGTKEEKLSYVKAAMKEPSSGSDVHTNKDTGSLIADEVESANPPPTDGSSDAEPEVPKEIIAKVVAVNQYSHLEGVVRQKGGIGSMAHDEKQKAITDFFGGGGSTKQDKPSVPVVPPPQPLQASDGEGIPMEG